MAARAAAFTLRGMPLDVLTLPFTVSHHDPSGLFVIETTVVAWREDRREPGQIYPVSLTLGAGTLHDADKGAFTLDGLELTLRISNRGSEPLSVRAPGALSEVQQEALLDAVCSVLDAAGQPFPQPPRSE